MKELAWTVDEVAAVPWQGRAIAHLDLDAFFASVAQLDNPELRGKPVIVGSRSGRGVVSTCSYEARAYGVRSAMPSSRAEKLCPDATWVPGDFPRYRELSDRIFNALYEITPHVRRVSIDEAFFDITPDASDPRHPVSVAREILARVAQTGITGSIGLSTSMSVAKIGSDFQKPRGLTVVPQERVCEFLCPLPVRKLWGIGPKAEEGLRHLGVMTLGDLAELDEVLARGIFGKNTREVLDRAVGIDERTVPCNDPVKSVSNEYTFSRDISTKDKLRKALNDIAAQVGRRLRQKGLRGHCVTLKLRFGDFQTKTVSRTLPVAVDNEKVIAPLAFELAGKVWSEGMGVRLLGIGVSHFDEDGSQLSLFDDETDEEHIATVTDEQDERLTERLDDIKNKFGDEAVLLGRQIKQRDKGTSA